MWREGLWSRFGGAGIVKETSPLALITVKRMGSRHCLERGFLGDVS